MAKYNMSIIIPTFNSEDTVEETFNSVKSQTLGFDNIEIIFVDDQSIDGTYKIVERYSIKYPNVKLFKTDENSHFAGKPRNIGLINSNSEYMLFLDSDDQLFIDSCEVLYKNITSTNSDIVIGGHVNYYENTQQEHNSPLYSGRIETFTNVQDANLLNITPAITAKLFKKELLIENKIKFPEGIPGQDLVFLLESILNSKKITVLNNYYVYFRNINNNSVSFNITANYLQGLIHAYKLVCDILETQSVDEEIQKIILHNHMGFLTTQLIRSSSSNTIDDLEVKEIINSSVFDELANENIFRNDELFVEFFNNIRNGQYNNRALLARLRENINTDLITGHHGLKNELEKLNKNYMELAQEHNTLDKSYKELTLEHENLTEVNAKITTEHSILENKYEIVANKNIELENEFDILRNNHEKLNNDLNDLNAEFTTLTENYDTLKDHDADLEYECKKIQKNLDELQNEYENLTLKHQKLEDLNTKVSDNLKQFKDEFNNLKKLQIRTNNENNYLKINNHNLIKDLNKTTKEINEIKSSKLWKIINKF